MIFKILKKYKKNCLLFIFLFIIFNINFGFSITKADKFQEILNRGEIFCVTNAEFPPWEYLESDKFKGIDIEICEKIAEKLNLKLKINNVSFEAIPLELANKKCDFAIAAMSPTEEKKKSVDFSISYFTAGQCVLVKNNDIINNFTDLAGKKIGVCIGSTGQTYCESKYENVIIFNSLSESVLSLNSGSIDAIVVDNQPAKNYEMKYRGKIKILDGYLFMEDYCIAVPKGNDEFLNQINKILNELKSEGYIDLLLNKYTKEDVILERTFKDQIYDNLIIKDRYKLILRGLLETFKIAFFALFIGLFIGSISAVIISLQNNSIFKNNNKILKLLILFLSYFFKLYIDLIRGTPVVCQLFIIYYIVFSPLGIDKVIAAIVAFGVNSGAYVSEIIRNAILSIDKGQIEGARSLGFSNKKTFLYIIIPQAIKNSLPLFCNEIIQIIKETSVAGLIGVVDLSRASEVIRSQTLEPFVPLMSISIIYFSVILIINFIMRKFEEKLRKSDKSDYK